MTPARTRTLTVPRPGVPLASRWSRFLAWFLDLLLNVGSALPAFTAAVAVPGDGEHGALPYVAIGLACYLCLWAYQAWLRATRGQTIGKRVVGIRIVSHEDGSNPGFWRAVFLRDLVPWFIDLLVFRVFGIIDVAFILGRERRCVHDYMAATMVVQADLPAPGADLD